MILAFKVKPEKWKEVPAIVHVDGSARPQSVMKKTNPKYYKMIREFEKLSGVPIVLNTSFNVNKEPIVLTPSDAIKCFLSTGIDALAINDYLVEK